MPAWPASGAAPRLIRTDAATTTITNRRTLDIADPSSQLTPPKQTDYDGPVLGSMSPGDNWLDVVATSVAREIDRAEQRQRHALSALSYLLLAPGIEGVVHGRLQPDLLVVLLSVDQGEAVGDGLQ